MPATPATIIARLDAGQSVDESDLIAATDADLAYLVDEGPARRYPASLLEAAHAELGRRSARPAGFPAELVTSLGRCYGINFYNAEASLKEIAEVVGTAGAVRFATRVLDGEDLTLDRFYAERVLELEDAAEERDYYGDPREAMENRAKALKVRAAIGSTAILEELDRDVSTPAKARRLLARIAELEAPIAPTDEDLGSGDWLAENVERLTPEQRERAAELVAEWNPRNAIEGWRSGDAVDSAGIYERALEIQDARRDLERRAVARANEPSLGDVLSPYAPGEGPDPDDARLAGLAARILDIEATPFAGGRDNKLEAIYPVALELARLVELKAKGGEAE